MEPIDVLKKIFGITEHDTSKWVRVAKLTPEDMIRRRNLEADEANAHGEADVLKAKIHALLATQKAAGAEWWEHAHRTYSLPRERNFSLSDDGFILMEPKEGEKNDKA